MDGELTAVARGIDIGRAIASVHVDEAPHDRQSDPQPASRSIQAAFPLREQIKHARLQFLAHADAAITNAYDGVRADALGAHADLAAFGRELNGVAEHVTDHLNEA